MTMLEKFNAFPPCMCRLVARNGRRPMSHREIAKASGLSVDTVARLSLKMDWSGVKIDVAVKFSAGCNVNHMALERTMDYVRRRSMAHLKLAGKNQRKFHARIYRLDRNDKKKAPDVNI